MPDVPAGAAAAAGGAAGTGSRGTWSDAPGPAGERSHRPLVVVAGGGVAGLAAAWELAGAGVRVVVVEESHATGGKLRRQTVAGVPVDVGPDAFVARRPEARDLCQELGLADRLVGPGAAGAQVWSRGRLRRLPDGLVLGVPTRMGPLARSGILGPVAVARAAADLAADLAGRRSPELARLGSPGDDRSVAELVGPRLGWAVVTQLVDPLVGGIHAGPVAAMSAAAVFPMLLQAAAQPGSLQRALRRAAPAGAGDPASRPLAAPHRPGAAGGPAGPAFLAPRDGMATLAEALTAALAERGVELRLATAVTAVRPVDGAEPGWHVDTTAGPLDGDGLVLCLPPRRAAATLDTTRPPLGRLARHLAAVDHAGVAVVTLAFRTGGPAERWRRAPFTGFLVPVAQGLLTTGCTWLSAKWPDAYGAGPVMVRLSAGRDGDGRALALDDTALVRRLLGELRAMAGDVDDPVDVQVTRWTEAFPQYRVGHLAWAASAAAAEMPGLAVAGAAFDGVGVPACIGSGRRAARRVLAGLRVAT